MDERRQYPRDEVQQDVYMILNDKNILGNLQNISCAGAYIKVDDKFRHEMPMINVGLDVVIIFNSGKQTIKGRVLRYVNQENAIFIAIYFLQTYDFDN